MYPVIIKVEDDEGKKTLLNLSSTLCAWQGTKDTLKIRFNDGSVWTISGTLDILYEKYIDQIDRIKE